MDMNLLNRSWCADCASYVRGSQLVHMATKRHARSIAGPVSRRKSERTLRRARAYRMLAVEPSTLDDPEPTHKLCAGIPSLDVEAHFEPLEAFHRNRAYPDGWYVRCHSCHQFYLYSLKLRKAVAPRGDWPTPRASAGEQLWPTPRASEWKGTGPLGSKSHDHRVARGYLDATVQDHDQASGPLDPSWVEWLMGFSLSAGPTSSSAMISSSRIPGLPILPTIRSRGSGGSGAVSIVVLSA